MAEAEISTRGRAAMRASAFTSARVVSTRLLRKSFFRSSVQRPSAIGAPARFTTASAPTAAPPISPVAGSHFTSNPCEAFAAGSTGPGLINRQTVCPACCRFPPSAVPTEPVAPVTRIFISLSSLERSLIPASLCRLHDPLLAPASPSGYNFLVMSVSPTIHVKVLFFGRLRELVGIAEETAEVSDGATLAELFQQYANRLPALAAFRSSLVASINQEFAAWD